MSQNKLHRITGFFRSTKSMAENTRATSASCQNKASGVHADHGRSRPATASSLATTSVPKRAGVREWWSGGVRGVLECWSVGVLEYWGFIIASLHYSITPSLQPP